MRWCWLKLSKRVYYEYMKVDLLLICDVFAKCCLNFHSPAAVPQRPDSAHNPANVYSSYDTNASPISYNSPQHTAQVTSRHNVKSPPNSHPQHNAQWNLRQVSHLAPSLLFTIFLRFVNWGDCDNWITAKTHLNSNIEISQYLLKVHI